MTLFCLSLHQTHNHFHHCFSDQGIWHFSPLFAKLLLEPFDGQFDLTIKMDLAEIGVVLITHHTGEGPQLHIQLQTVVCLGLIMDSLETGWAGA